MSMLAHLRAPGDRRIAVRLTADALRQVRAGHPWVYASSITSISHEGAAGDLAVIFDADRRFAAIGLYDPESPIRVRVLHRGKPVPIDRSWWISRIEAAAELRRPLATSSETTAFRCINGEGDGVPGLVFDRYGDVGVMKLYSAAWVPHLPTLVPILTERFDLSTVVLRTSRTLDPRKIHGLHDATALVGVVPNGAVPFLEHGLSFEAEVVRGHKTGHFLDQRDNRARVRAIAGERRVLDVFSYTGGFALHAAAGGATSVQTVDISPHASKTVTRHFELNRSDENVRRCRLRTTTGDAFEVLRRLDGRRERFDLVVIDPPSFTSKQADVPQALRAYSRLTELGVALVGNGGTLVQASCSARVTAEQFFSTVTDAARRMDVRLDEIERTGHPVDHPVSFAEGAYLKAMFATVHHHR